MTARHQVNPQHGKRLEQARDRKFAGVDRLEAQRRDEVEHDFLAGWIIASDKHHRLAAGKSRIGHDLETDLVHRLIDARASGQFCDLLGTGSVEADSESKAGTDGIGDIDENLASKIAGRRDRGAFAAYGVASTTTSASAAAARTPAKRASPLIVATKALASVPSILRTPKQTACPSSAQRRPSVPPTDPVPITAIFMTASHRTLRKSVDDIL
jgi:hypothetical protein